MGIIPVTYYPMQCWRAYIGLVSSLCNTWWSTLDELTSLVLPKAE